MILGRMQLTLHATRRTAHGASRLVQAMSAWLVKTRHAPSRHSRDARVYGHTTTAIHKLSTPPPHRLSSCLSQHQPRSLSQFSCVFSFTPHPDCLRCYLYNLLGRAGQGHAAAGGVAVELPAVPDRRDHTGALGRSATGHAPRREIDHSDR